MNEQISSRLAGSLRGFLCLALLMFASGGALNGIYGPNRAQVESVFRPAVESGFWKFLAAFHYWGSAALIVSSGAIVVWLFLRGLQTKSKAFWVPMLAATALAIGLQVLGNLLPLDRHDVQTANTEASILARTPILGPKLSTILLDGNQFSESTIGRWYSLTMILVVAFAGVCVWVFLKLRQEGRVRLDLGDMAAGGIIGLAPVLLALLVPRATGELYLPIDAASQSASPSWYVLPMHALLHLFDGISPSLGWIGTVVLPGLGALAAATAPMWSRNWSDQARRNVVLALGCGTILLVGFSGTMPAPISGDQPINEIVAGKGGPVDSKLAADGLQFFNMRCSGCHALGGKGGSGAPSLLQVQKKTTDPQWFMDFIRDPSSKKPGTTMPAFPKIPEAELKAIAEWLRSDK